jgi:MFS family permease
LALKNPNIRRLELVWGLAIAAEWAHFVALGVFAYHHGGAQFVGLAGFVRLMPAGLLAPFASSLGDRFRRDRLLLFLLVIEAAALVGSGAAAAANNRVAVLLLAAVIGMTSTVVRPMFQSILPSLARTATELVASNAASSAFEGLGVLVGPLVAGSAILIVGAGGVFVVAGAASLLAAAILLRTAVPRQADLPPSGRDSHHGREKSPVRLTLAGFGLVARDSQLRLLVGLACAPSFVRGCLSVLVVVAAFGILHAGSPGVGYLNAGLGIGGLLGAFGATTLSTKRLAVSFGLALTFWGAPISALSALSWLGPAILCLVVVGGANSVEDVAVITLLQRGVTDELLSSLLGMLWGMVMVAVAVGSLVAPAIVNAVGIRPALLFVGLILPVLALVSARRLVRIDASFHPSPALDLIDSIPMFAPLSIVIKERLAQSLSPVSIRAGETLIHSGDTGDRLYLVRNGRLAIVRAGRQVATLCDGDCVGEIALLHRVPRTASVRAEVDTALYSLGREAFLHSITGTPAAMTEAHRVASERLAEHDELRPPPTDERS